MNQQASNPRLSRGVLDFNHDKPNGCLFIHYALGTWKFRKYKKTMKLVYLERCMIEFRNGQ